MEFQSYQPNLGYIDTSYVDFEDRPYAGSRYAMSYVSWLICSTEEPKYDPSLIEDQEESEPARRKRQKFNRSRTACHPVCPLEEA